MREFLDLTHYPCHSLCIFYNNTSLNERSRACLPMEGPRGSFAQYMEWVLLSCGSLFTVCPVEKDIASPNSAMDPEPCQHSSMSAMQILSQSLPQTQSLSPPQRKARAKALARGQFQPRARAQCGVWPGACTGTRVHHQGYFSGDRWDGFQPCPHSCYWGVCNELGSCRIIIWLSRLNHVPRSPVSAGPILSQVVFISAQVQPSSKSPFVARVNQPSSKSLSSCLVLPSLPLPPPLPKPSSSLASPPLSPFSPLAPSSVALPCCLDPPWADKKKIHDKKLK